MAKKDQKIAKERLKSSNEEPKNTMYENLGGPRPLLLTPMPIWIKWQ